MVGYIDRQALGIGKCNPDVFENKGYAEGWNSAIEIIENAPAADVAPVKHGKWIKVTVLCGVDVLKCSVCGCEHPRRTTDFCCDCGAKMDGKETE